MKQQQTKIFVYKNNAPKYNIYWDLCLDALKNNISNDFELHILNKENIHKYINHEFLNKDFINKNELCIKDLDYLKFCILYLHGGIFLDGETIINKDFSPYLNLLNNFDLVVFGESANKLHKGLIMANKNAPILKNIILRQDFYLNKTDINYFSTLAIEDVLKYYDTTSYIVLDTEKSGYLMEKAMYGICNEITYNNCYFSNDIKLNEFFEKFSGVVALKKEYLPQNYSKMNKKDFLKQDILISKIFKNFLQS